MTFVRIMLGGLLVMLAVIVAIPAVVLFDLVIGGTGLGLCPTGLGTCSTSAFTLMELVGLLVGSAVLIGAGIVGCQHLLQRAAPRR